MTWRWNACSIRLTPMSPSRTSSDDSRDGPFMSPRLARRRLDDVGAGEPVVEPTLLAIEGDPEEAETERRERHEVAERAQAGAPHRGRVAVNVNDSQV